jgi:putative phosphoribosyl transferase
MRFRDRSEAGRLLAEELSSYADRPDVLMLALPRGGVPVAYEIAQHLHLPLDVWLVRKLGAPRIPELAIGAIASGGIETIAFDAVRRLSITDSQLKTILSRERQELARREVAYRGDRPPVEVRNSTVILVDDGIATGASMLTAIASLRRLEPGAIVVGVPVVGAFVCSQLAREADQVVCLWTPEELNSVGEWYGDFSQTSDEEVCTLLERARQFAARLGPGLESNLESGLESSVARP